MTQDEVIALARKAGFGASNPFSPVVVRHANGSWVSITEKLVRLADLVEQRVLLRQTIASTAVVVGPEQRAQVDAFLKELDAKEVWHQSGRLEPGEPINLAQPRTTRYWPGFTGAGIQENDAGCGVGTVTQPDAVRLADALDSRREPSPTHYINQAAELRRLHVENEAQKKALRAYRCLHAANLDCLERYKAVKSERDELLEAIAGLVGCIDHGSENPTEKLDAARRAIVRAAAEISLQMQEGGAE